MKGFGLKFMVKTSWILSEKSSNSTIIKNINEKVVSVFVSGILVVFSNIFNSSLKIYSWVNISFVRDDDVSFLSHQ